MSKLPFNVTPEGVVETLEYMHETDSAVIHAKQDVEFLLDYNKAEQNNGLNGWTQDRTMKKLATLTPLMLMEMNQKFSDKMRAGTTLMDRENSKLFLSILKSPDYQHLRAY